MAGGGPVALRPPGPAASTAAPERERDYLLTLARLLATQRGLDEVSQGVVNTLGPALGAARAFVGYYPLAAETYEFQYRWVAPGTPEAGRIRLLPFARNAVTQVLATGAVWRCDDIAADPRVAGMRPYYARLGTTANLFAGIWVEGRWWGTVGVHQRHWPRRWTEAEAALVAATADLLSLAILAITKREEAEGLTDAMRLREAEAAAPPRRPSAPPVAPPRITRAEARIIALVAEGRTNAEIAAALNLSRRTVETHVTNMLNRLGLRNRVELVRAVFGP
jgi:DNA-binding CsgD family transcriptional regulator